jgi:hypothetical protein
MAPVIAKKNSGIFRLASRGNWGKGTNVSGLAQKTRFVGKDGEAQGRGRKEARRRVGRSTASRSSSVVRGSVEREHTRGTA